MVIPEASPWTLPLLGLGSGDLFEQGDITLGQAEETTV